MCVQEESPKRPVVLGAKADHYWLVQRMAKATGVDLVRASEAEVLDQETWSDVVTRCRACVWAEGCARWLDMSDDAERPAPENCLNRQKMDAIRRALEI